MRVVFGTIFIAVAIGFALETAPAQMTAPECAPHEAGLAGIGRAGVVAFTGAVDGERVCALVANLSAGAVQARIVDGAPGDALVAAALTAGSGATLLVNDGALAVAASSDGPADGLPVGPFVVPPGGGFPALDAADTEQARVVLAYSGPRLVVIRTTPVTVIDLARAMRDQPDLFGIDAPERAVVLASGPAAELRLRTDAGTMGADPATPKTLVLIRQP